MCKRDRSGEFSDEAVLDKFVVGRHVIKVSQGTFIDAGGWS